MPAMAATVGLGPLSTWLNHSAKQVPSVGKARYCMVDEPQACVQVVPESKTHR